MSPLAHHWRGIDFSISNLQQLLKEEHLPKMVKLVLIDGILQYTIYATDVCMKIFVIVEYRFTNLKQILSATAPYFSGEAVASGEEGK
jgi:hypothetical protein